MEKTVFITGGSRGIGAATVERFHREGWRVAFCYRNAQRHAVKLQERCPGLIALRADLGDPAQAQWLAEQALAHLGQVDALVLNAGVSLQKLLPDTTCEEWDRLFDVNLRAPFLLCRALLPHMIARQSGSIVTVASMWGEVGASCEVAYSAAKAGLIGFTRALAKEVGPSGIRVNCVSPGVIATEMNAAHSLETLAALADETPLGELGTPAQVAQAIYYLAGEQSAFITGQVLGVNGGLCV